jgi:hypothetical protein
VQAGFIGVFFRSLCLWGLLLYIVVGDTGEFWKLLLEVEGCLESVLVSDPVMMEMRASRLVAGFHDRVVGIAGERRDAMLGCFCLLVVPLPLLLCIVVGGFEESSKGCVEYRMLSNGDACL